MNYQEFLDYIKENLIEYLLNRKMDESKVDTGSENEDICKKDLPKKEEVEQEEYKQEEYEVDIHKVIKNNGIVLDGLTLRKKGECMSPNIYLNSYFDAYQMGKPITQIMEEILFHYYRAKEENDIHIEDILNYNAIKDKIILRIVNYDKNKELLKNCPYKKYLDLAVTFRYIADKDTFGIASSLISNMEFKEWGIDLEQLYQVALFNTMREFPWKMDSLAKVIGECLREKAAGMMTKEMLEDIEELEKSENKVNMYVLSNESGINGATCILYDNVIKKFAKVQDANVFILPSSIHEVMLVPENEETEAAFLADLVVEANNSAVGLIDLLSNHIYYYDREKEQMYIYGKSNID